MMRKVEIISINDLISDAQLIVVLAQEKCTD